MRTRRGQCYPEFMNLRTGNNVGVLKRGNEEFVGDVGSRRKTLKKLRGEGTDFFYAVPDDIVLAILCKLSSSASSPADFVNVLMTCKRLHGLGLHSAVLSKASPKTLSVKAKNWTESAHRFLKLCVDAGNVEACFFLGMIRFYCLLNRGSGASLMAKAAVASHAPALYSLAVIQFNGSGGSKSDKDLHAGVALCARAAVLGHVDALRELGHCLQDGYGVKQNVSEGRRLLIQANARELAAVIASAPRSLLAWNPRRHVSDRGCLLLSDFGCNVPPPEVHPANQFLADWFSHQNPGQGLQLCSHPGCSRPETRRHEFRRCSVCGLVTYCSRACQALDWKLRHKMECAVIHRMMANDGRQHPHNPDGDDENHNGQDYMDES